MSLFVLNYSVLLILSSFLHCLLAAKRYPSVNNQIQDVDDMMKSILKCRDSATVIPGISLSVVHQGRVMMSRGYGVTDVDEPRHVNEKTLFGIGSATKTFTATLLAKLLHSHPRYSLRTPISKIIKEKFHFRDAMRTSHASLEDLLAHRMGLVPHSYMVYQHQLTRKKLSKKMSYLRPVAKFRDSYMYSDVMYGMAAYVTERLSYQTWEDTLTKELFRPLKMANSRFLHTFNPLTTDVATPYLYDGQRQGKMSFRSVREVTKMGGGRSILSNAADMGKWMMFHLSKGRNDKGKRVVNQRALANTYKAVSTRPTSMDKYFQEPHTPVSWIDHSLSVGWKNGFYRGYPILSSMRSPKSSPPVGYQSFMTLFPSHRLGIFTAHNGKETHHLLQTALHAFISDVFLKQDIWLNTSSICSFPKPWQFPPPARTQTLVNKETAPTRDHSYYTGIFYNGIYGRIVVFRNQTTKRLQLQYGDIKCQFYAQSADIFIAEGTGDFWFFAITVIYQLERKPGYISILEFVPKHPARFKKTHSEVPVEFLTDPVTMTTRVYQSPTTTADVKQTLKLKTASDKFSDDHFTSVPTWNRWSFSTPETTESTATPPITTTPMFKTIDVKSSTTTTGTISESVSTNKGSSTTKLKPYSKETIHPSPFEHSSTKSYTILVTRSLPSPIWNTRSSEKDRTRSFTREASLQNIRTTNQNREVSTSHTRTVFHLSTAQMLETKPLSSQNTTSSVKYIHHVMNSTYAPVYHAETSSDTPVHDRTHSVTQEHRVITSSDTREHNVVGSSDTTVHRPRAPSDTSVYRPRAPSDTSVHRPIAPSGTSVYDARISSDTLSEIRDSTSSDSSVRRFRTSNDKSVYPTVTSGNKSVHPTVTSSEKSVHPAVTSSDKSDHPAATFSNTSVRRVITSTETFITRSASSDTFIQGTEASRNISVHRSSSFSGTDAGTSATSASSQRAVPTHSTINTRVNQTSPPGTKYGKTVSDNEIPEPEIKLSEDKVDQNNINILTNSGVGNIVPIFSILYFLSILAITLTGS